jgi:PPOX class probable FMN-dependent enzyme
MKTETVCGYELTFAETQADFRTLYAAPSDLSVKKSLKRLDGHCRRFIELSPFVCIGTAGPDGPADISPRGDAPGFVRVLDPNTLLIPDRLGNNRLDTLGNVVANPQVGLLFLVPGIDETLRVNGRGRIVTGGKVLEEMRANGKVPTTALLIAIEEAFLQCAKALVRSKLWHESAKIPRNAYPTLGKILADQIGGYDIEQLDCQIDAAYREKLY